MDDLRSGASALRRLRQRRGLSCAALARALTDQAVELGLPRLPSVASVQRTLTRWESASPTRPDHRYQLLLAHLYGRTPAGGFALGAGSDFAELMEALARLGEGERQLCELRAAMVRAATARGGGPLVLLPPSVQGSVAAALADPGRADGDLVEGLSTAVAEVNAQVGAVPMVRLRLVLDPLAQACRQLLAGPVAEPLLPGLRLVAVAAHTLNGRLAFETRDDAASRAAYATATAEAARLEDPWHRAAVLLSHALTALYSRPDPAPARRLADAAVRDACRGGSPTVRARGHALQAELAARAGAPRAARDALGLARYDLESDRSGDPSPGSFSTEHLRGFEGVCELYAGDAARAHAHFGEAVAALASPRERVQRAIVATDQARARIRMGDPRAAVDLLHECAEAARSSGGRVPAIRLRHARRDLRPWSREDWVADLDDHLVDALGA
ncbi:hypothetical protein ABT160_44640 [Streptomyces sp. NPDC001941]|uniref:hypothetical protein n=1 Tax=Streptomyces sp. NPDC001941 TaxID=3154659 RepID=UPI00332B4182